MESNTNEKIYYICSEGFTLIVSDSADYKIAEIINDTTSIGIIRFKEKGEKYISNNLQIDKIDSFLEISLSGTPVYSDCILKEYREKNFPTAKEDEEVAQFIVNHLLKGNLDSIHPDQREYVYDKIDLNNDGNEEYFVIPMAKNFCNTSGCLVYILDHNKKQISSMRIGGPPICVEENENSGYRNILFYTNRQLKRAIYNSEEGYPLHTNSLPTINKMGYNCTPLFGGSFPKERLKY